MNVIYSKDNGKMMVALNYLIFISTVGNKSEMALDGDSI